MECSRLGRNLREKKKPTLVSRVEKLLTILSTLGGELLKSLDVYFVEDLSKGKGKISLD